MGQLTMISQGLVQPIIKSNIQYVNSMEEFEAIELELNQALLCFDNNAMQFYIKERDRFGEYTPIKVFFYEDFAKKMQSADHKEFYKKCEALKLDPLKRELAYKFFIENAKTQAVWLWLLETKKADWSWDTVKHIRWKLKKAFIELEPKN